MKKTALTLLLTGAAIGVQAQTIQDALRFSESNYEGTARTLAMGNAFTALGGDLGAVSINPAGSAVAGYGQITITPGLNISTNTAGGTTLAGQSSPASFQNRLTNSRTRFSVPNYGVTMNFDLHRNKGLKNITVGFIANATNRFQESMRTSGTNNTTSFTGSEAYWAGGYDYNELIASDAYDYYSAPWRTIVAAQSGMISSIAGSSTEFVGAAEVLTDNEIHIGGPLDQVYQKQTAGSKYDYVFNIGFNISDFVYLGANLGISSLNYDSAWRFNESAVYPEDFPNRLTFNEGTAEETVIDTEFNSMQYDYRYSASGAGVYGKFGVIVTPFKGLRIGAAVQTPTGLTIRETWSESGSTTFTDSRCNAGAESPVGEYEYRLVSPFRANFGAAWTFGTYGLVSVDYELCDYSTMRFREIGMQSGEFDYQNTDIKDYMGTGHQIRVGAEFKPLPQIAIRAGYNLTTSPEKALDDAGNFVYIGRLQKGTSMHKGSFGIGYSSDGSFFIDAACSFTGLPDEYIIPYDDYMYDDSGYLDPADYTPEILNRRTLWNVLLTFGFRF